MSLPNLLILALATWYISHCVTREKGAFNVFGRIREYLPLGGLTLCIYCLSVWVAIPCYILLNTRFAVLVYLPAIAGAALMMRSYTGAGMHE